MRRLAVLLCGCQNLIYPPFNGDGGGGTTGATTVIGGNGQRDLSVLADGGTTSLPSGTVRALSGPQSRFSASFLECPASSVSGCVVRDCVPADLSVGSYTVNAGTLRLLTPSVDLMLPPASDGEYLPLTRTGPLWSLSGAQVTLSATGADYPPFSVTLDGPTTVTVTNPLAGALDVPRTADFSVSWAGGTSGHITVELVTATQSLSCDFGLASGSGLVPRQALTRLAAGAATLAILVVSSTTVDSVVQVRAEVAGEDVGGMPFSAAVNLR